MERNLKGVIISSTIQIYTTLKRYEVKQRNFTGDIKEWRLLRQEIKKFYKDHKVELESLFCGKHIKGEYFDFDVFGINPVTSRSFEDSKLV